VSLLTEIEIARAAKKKSIFEIGDGVGILSAELFPSAYDNAWFAE
jgi:16S rRNA A1518/A1519 N6-dimethyltransferase RsmA/KsgA/DIM1 with predicted DNA glycosylase/AP lyase activity